MKLTLGTEYEDGSLLFGCQVNLRIVLSAWLWTVLTFRVQASSHGFLYVPSTLCTELISC